MRRQDQPRAALREKLEQGVRRVPKGGDAIGVEHDVAPAIGKASQKRPGLFGRGKTRSEYEGLQPPVFQQVREVEFALDRIVVETLQRLQGLPTLLAVEFGLIPDVEMIDEDCCARVTEPT